MTTYEITLTTTFAEFVFTETFAPEALRDNLRQGQPIEFEFNGVVYCVPANQMVCLSWRQIPGGAR